MTLKKKVVVMAMIYSGVITLFTQVCHADIEDVAHVDLEHTEITMKSNDGASTAAAVGAVVTHDDSVTIADKIDNVIDSAAVTEVGFCAKYPPGTAGCPKKTEVLSDEPTELGTKGVIIRRN